MMKNANIISITKDGREPFSAAYAIWMQKKGDNSKETQRVYERTFKEFFMFRLNKQPECVTWEDLAQIKNVDFEKFQSQLIDRGLEPTTINAYMYHLSWLWKRIARADENIRPGAAIVDPVSDKRDKDSLGADALTEREISLLIDYAKTVDFHPELQALLFEFALYVPLRITALRNITWNSFKEVRGNNGQKLWEVTAWDKGKIHKNPISDKFYQRLQVLKTVFHNGVGFMDKPDSKVFYISVKKIRETLDGFKKKYGIDKQLSPHTLKKTSAQLMYEITGGDIRQVQAHTQHNSRSLALKYAQSRERLDSIAPYMFENREKMREDLLSIPHEELVRIITDQDNFPVTYAIHQLASV